MWETSYLWYLRPDCVDLSVYRGQEDEPLVGVMDGPDPRTHASPELGRRSVEMIVEAMVRKSQELLTESGFTSGCVDGAPKYF